MLKRFTLLLCGLFLLSGQAFSQRTYDPVPRLQKTRSLDQRPIATPRAVMDTILPDAFLDTCGLNLFSFGITDRWGFLAGTNEFGDREKAQRFDFPGSSDTYTVNEVWVFFAEASIVGDGDVTVKIYDASNDGVPNAVVGTSNAIKTSELNIDPNDILATIFTFDTPPTVGTSQFFASVDLLNLYAAGDTLGILLTREGCGDGANSWELFSDGTTWTSIDAANSWQLESNFFIATIVEFDDGTTSIDNPFVTDSNLKLFPASPNPASTETLLNYELSENSPVSIEIYSADGRLMQTIDKGQQLAGPHQESIALDQFPAGSYVYGIVTQKARLMSKFVVNK